MALSIISSPTVIARPAAENRPRLVAAASLLFLAALWFILCRHLSSEWSINEQYSYGWFVPFFAAYLCWLRWESRPEGGGYRSSGKSYENNSERITDNPSPFLVSIFYFLLCFLLPLRFFEVGNPDWRPLGWLHAGIVVAVTLFIVWRAGGSSWLKHFAFPICFILVAVPWVSAIEMPVVQGLMRAVAAVAAETLNLLGVPAQLEGNLIRVRTGLVGVNEACSGVRSLQTSLMIGLLFGELNRFSFVRRSILLAGSIAIAILANCGRALLLVWLAAKGTTASVGRWHDLAGYSIVGLVFVGTIGLAALLGPNKTKPQTSEPKQGRLLNGTSPFVCAFGFAHWPILALVWVPAVEFGVEGWYRFHERNLVAEKGWTVRWPENALAFRRIEIDEGVRRTLRFDEGHETSWQLPAPNSPSVAGNANCVAYFFRWNSGGTSVVRARAHRPDICLPDAGWAQLADRGTAAYSVGDLRVPFRRVSFRKGNGNAVAHTFFCLQEDQRRLNEERPDLQTTGRQPDWSARGRFRVVRDGVRNLGQQVLEIAILTGERASVEDVEKQFAAMLPSLIVPTEKTARRR